MNYQRYFLILNILILTPPKIECASEPISIISPFLSESSTVNPMFFSNVDTLFRKESFLAFLGNKWINPLILSGSLTTKFSRVPLIWRFPKSAELTLISTLPETLESNLEVTALILLSLMYWSRSKAYFPIYNDVCIHTW